MADYSQSFAKFLNSDAIKLSGPRTFTIKSVAQEEIGRDDGPKDKKVVARFVEDDRGFVINKTNYEIMSDLFGSPDTDRWVGNQIDLYFDPTVRRPAGGRGGIGVRPPSAKRV